MTGIAPWSLEELQTVATHHGETLVDLFGEQKSADYETALLIAGPLRVTCRLWPGQPLAQHRPGDLIAIKGGSEWVVMVAGDTPTPQACTVRRLIIEPKPDRPRRFAILDDDIDEIVFATIDSYSEVPLRAVSKATTSEDLKDQSVSENAEGLQPLLDKLKATLGDRVKDVRASVRLAESPSCIVSDEDEPSMQMQQMLRAMGQTDFPAPKPTLEINPDHEIVKKLLARPDDAITEDAAWLLFDQALLMEGVALKEPAAFVQRLNRILNKSI